MQNFWSIVTIALGLIFVYLVVTHGDVAVNLVNAGTKLATSETTALQGR